LGVRKKPKQTEPPPVVVKRVRMGRQGRVVLPAEARQALGLQPGDELTVMVAEEGKIILETTAAAIRAAQRAWAGEPKRRLSAELIRERRREGKSR
jgi:AbrB family looped-hinge helix DNA binding protein